MEGERQPLLSVGVKLDRINESNGSRKSAATQASGISWVSAAFILINTILNTGLLEFPYAVHRAGGLVVTMSVQIVVVGLMVVTLMALVSCSGRSEGVDTYTSILLRTCGKKTELCVALCIVLLSFGVSIMCLIAAGDQLDQLLYFVHGGGYCKRWYTSRQFALSLSATVIVLPLCIPKRVEFLKYAGYLGIVPIGYVVCLVTVKYYLGNIEPGEVKLSPTKASDVFFILPTILFAYQCQVCIVPVYSCMREKDLRSLGKSVAAAMLVSALAYSVVASFGYYTFGDKVDPDILTSYSPPTTDVIIGVSLVAVKMYLAYPMICFNGRAELEKLWAHAWRLTDGDGDRGEGRRRVGFTLAWYFTSLSLAMFTPDISVAIRFCGSLSSAFVFTFPGMALFATARSDAKASTIRNRLLAGTAICMILTGTLAFGLIITQAAIEYVHSTSSIKEDLCFEGQLEANRTMLTTAEPP